MNPLDIAKKRAELQKAVESNIAGQFIDGGSVLSSLEKAGTEKQEAVIGRTKSGKKIYRDKKAGAYTDFTAQDHYDAFDVHDNETIKYLNLYDPDNIFPEQKLSTEKKEDARKKFKFHSMMADSHVEAYKKSTNLKKGMENDLLEKAGANNPNLRLVHIIDKNGVHRVVWKLPEEIEKLKETKSRIEDVKPGDKVTVDGESWTIRRLVPADGYVRVQNDTTGKKAYRTLNKVRFPHPETGEETLGGNEVQRAAATGGSGGYTNPDVEPEQARDYEVFGTPAERMQDWADMIKNFADDKSKNLTVAYGTGGVGKTFNVLKNEKIKKGLEDGTVVKFTGGTTAAGFFEMLYKNRDKKIILDDFDMVFNDPGMLGLLATISRSSEERLLSNPNSSKSVKVQKEESDEDKDEDSVQIPSKFTFTGKLMVISNIDLDDEAAGSGGNANKFEELLGNANKVDLKMSKKETWDLINEFILHKNGEVNMDLKFQDAFGSPKEVSKEDREELAEYFKKNWKEMRELSGRTLTKANAIQQFYKRRGANWQEKADQMLLQGGDENIGVRERFRTFNDSIDMIASGELKSAIIGAQNADNIVEHLKNRGFKCPKINGVPKEHVLIDQMKPDYVPHPRENFVTDTYVVETGSNFTDRKLYETLWKHNGKVIIFDNSAKAFLQSDLGQGLLKGALDTSGDGEIAWLSKSTGGKVKPPKKDKDMPIEEYHEMLRREGFKFDIEESGKVINVSHPYDIPDKFQFKGRCIFVGDVDDAEQPIKSRSMIADIKTTPEEFLTVVNDVIEHREREGLAFSHIFKGVDKNEYREAVEIMNKLKDKIHPRHFTEEGIQTIINIKRENEGQNLTEEQRIAKYRRRLAKSFYDDLNYGNDNIIKAFKSLL